MGRSGRKGGQGPMGGGTLKGEEGERRIKVVVSGQREESKLWLWLFIEDNSVWGIALETVQ
ncbi:hypothetical protein M9H77_17702 [Catharanthus roseus]|uniref:Uncharacterized protein n=1 Tax=Catharanthus roseus TaxID=4058 RepID=A0ACC0B5D0_CATRO|nr:hypothetical protein M9H77_17702 [Catharanthus roseus]